jgi:hypothetical protein
MAESGLDHQPCGAVLRLGERDRHTVFVFGDRDCQMIICQMARQAAAKLSVEVDF